MLVKIVEIKVTNFSKLRESYARIRSRDILHVLLGLLKNAIPVVEKALESHRHVLVVVCKHFHLLQVDLLEKSCHIDALDQHVNVDRKLLVLFVVLVVGLDDLGVGGLELV
jgi:hypothetical protein